MLQSSTLSGHHSDAKLVVDNTPAHDWTCIQVPDDPLNLQL